MFKKVSILILFIVVYFNQVLAIAGSTDGMDKKIKCPDKPTLNGAGQYKCGPGEISNKPCKTNKNADGTCVPKVKDGEDIPVSCICVEGKGVARVGEIGNTSALG